jgi:putative ABC transport system permease protein
MNSFTIALKSVRQRALASGLTAFSMALGVMLVVAVLIVMGVVTEQFRSNASLGYNLLIGAKGGRLQLTLNSVYYLSQPIENVDYQFYLEFLEAEEREAQLRNSHAYWERVARQDAASVDLAAMNGIGMSGISSLVGAAAWQGMDLVEQDELGAKRDGHLADYVEFFIPLCLGDYLSEFRVVGTSPDMFTVLPQYLEEDDRRMLTFHSGGPFDAWSKEYGFFGAVIGAEVAEELNLSVGDRIAPAHGDPEGHEHERDFVIAGVLDRNGSPNDRAVFVNIEGFFLMDDHVKPILATKAESDAEKELSGAVELRGQQMADEASKVVSESDSHFAIHHLLPVEKREFTAGLLRTKSPMFAIRLANTINEGPHAQAVEPVREIYVLLDLFVRPIQGLLFVLAVMIVFVSGVSIMVSIYNSMADRRHEIAVMRALGASRGTIMQIILLESMIIAVGGGILGWGMGHVAAWTLSPWVEARTGVELGLFDVAPAFDLASILESIGMEATINLSVSELMLIPVLLVLAVLVGLLPAISAYRTEVADSLGK